MILLVTGTASLGGREHGQLTTLATRREEGYRVSLMGYGLCAKCPSSFPLFALVMGLDFGVGEDFMASFIRVRVGLGRGWEGRLCIHSHVDD